MLPKAVVSAEDMLARGAEQAFSLGQSLDSRPQQVLEFAVREALIEEIHGYRHHALVPARIKGR